MIKFSLFFVWISFNLKFQKFIHQGHTTFLWLCHGHIVWIDLWCICFWEESHSYLQKDKRIFARGYRELVVFHTDCLKTRTIKCFILIFCTWLKKNNNNVYTSISVYISLYYVAFYVVMTALFSLAIYVLMYTLDPYTPDYQDRLKSPG